MMSESGEYVPSPRPNPRLRPEGAAYAERNRGTMERWFDYSNTMGDGASVGQAAGKVAQTTGDSSEPAAQQSSTSVGVTEAGEPNHGGMHEMTESYSSLNIDEPSPHQVSKAEASEYAERNRGQLDHIINNYGVTSASEQPTQREPPTTQNSVGKTQSEPLPTETNRSPVKQRTMHQESQGRTWDETRPAQRIRPDGESIAQKNSADSMFDIMRSDNAPQSSPVKEGKVSRRGEESAPPKQAASMPRTRPGEGTRNYQKAHNQSEMAAILRGEGNDGQSSAPRNIRHLQRSELW